MDERTWKDRQDSLDYTQWHPEGTREQDWSKLGEVEKLNQRIAQLEASQEALLAAAQARHLEIVALSERTDPFFYCTICGWSGPRSQLIWSVPRGYLCPECKENRVQRSSANNGKPLVDELAEAIGEIIEYRRSRCVRTDAQEARYKELTGYDYDNPLTDDESQTLADYGDEIAQLPG